PNSLFARFAEEPDSIVDARNLPIVVDRGSAVTTGLNVLDLLAPPGRPLRQNLLALRDPKTATTDDVRSVDLLLKGGNDGRRPTANEYEGAAEETSTRKTGLVSLEDIDDISIVAAPGSTFLFEDGYRDDAETIVQLLIGHAERMR